MLAGCASDDGGPTELTWYINPDNGGQATIAEQCSADSGGKYTITTSLLPRDAATQREQLARRLAAGDRSMDIMSLDPPFIPELAEPGFLAAPPQELVETATQDTLEGAQAGAQWDGELRHHMLRRDGSVRNSVFYSMLADEWPPARERLTERIGRPRDLPDAQQ